MSEYFVTGGSGFVGRNLITALVARGDRVRALARSDRAAGEVTALGATAVIGDLDVDARYASELRGVDAVFHVAAKAEEWGDPREFERVNVGGTEGVIDAARRAGIPALVHVSTEAVLLGQRLVRVTEEMPVPPRHAGLYAHTKALAEQRVVAANGPGLRTVVVRPRFIWGAGDTSLLPKILASVRSGRFAWIGGGRHLTSTTHVRNVVEALLLAEAKGRGGEVYFATDGEPTELRAFLTALLRTQGGDPGARSVPYAVAYAVASLSEAFARMTGGVPPLTRMSVQLIGREVTIDDAKIRRELGYVGAVSRDEGLAEMRAEGASRGGVERHAVARLFRS